MRNMKAMGRTVFLALMLSLSMMLPTAFAADNESVMDPSEPGQQSYSEPPDSGSDDQEQEHGQATSAAEPDPVSDTGTNTSPEPTSPKEEEGSGEHEAPSDTGGDDAIEDEPSGGDDTNVDESSGGSDADEGEPSGGGDANEGEPSGGDDANEGEPSNGGGDANEGEPSGGDDANVDEPSDGDDANVNEPSNGGDDANVDEPSGGDDANEGEPSGGDDANEGEPSNGGGDANEGEPSGGDDANEGEPSGGDDANEGEPSGGDDDANEDEPSDGGDDANEGEPSNGSDDANEGKPSDGGDDANVDEPSNGGGDANEDEPSNGGDDADEDDPSDGGDDANVGEPSSGDNDADEDEPSNGGDNDADEDEPSNGGDNDADEDEPSGGGDDADEDEPSGGGGDANEGEPSDGGDDADEGEPSSGNETQTPSNEESLETASTPEAASDGDSQTEGTEDITDADTLLADGALEADMPMMFALRSVETAGHTALEIVNELLSNEENSVYVDNDAEFAKDIAALVGSFSDEDLQKAGVADLLATLQTEGLSKDEALIAVRRLQAILSMTHEDTPIDSIGKLQDAINKANPGDTIKVSGDITGDFSVADKDITIDLQGHTIKGSGNKSVATVTSSSGKNSVTIQNGTITGGGKAKNGGGINANNILLTLYNLIVKGNSAENGGGIYADGGSLTVDLSTVEDNTAPYPGTGGGGIYANGGSLTVKDSAIRKNSAWYEGGGITSHYGTVNVKNSIISENSAFYGGGMMMFGSNVTMDKSTVSGNQATSMGGGINANGANLTIKGSTVERNTSDCGGGLSITGGNTSLEDSKVAGNQATSLGGGIYASGGTLKLNGTKVTENTASKQGGGIYLFGAEATILNAEIDSNNIDENTSNYKVYGGGVLSKDSKLTIKDSKIRNNHASIRKDTPDRRYYYGYGGGIAVLSNNTTPTTENTVRIYDTIISGNEADYGGGISGHTYLENCRIEGNKAVVSGGGIHTETKAGRTYAVNTVITENIATNGTSGTGGAVHIGASSNGFVMESGAIYRNRVKDELSADVYIQLGAGTNNPNFRVQLPRVVEMKDSEQDDSYFNGMSWKDQDGKLKGSITITSKEDDFRIFTVFAPAVDDGIFVDGMNGNDSDNGVSYYSPVKTFEHALDLAKANGYTSIYVLGKLTVSEEKSLSGLLGKGENNEDIRLTVTRHPVHTYKGILLEVLKSGNLTLRDIIFDGAKNNGIVSNFNGSLIRVNGGKLTLESGTTLQNNELAAQGNSTAGAGLYINGGEVTMKDGSAINGNVANAGQYSGGGGVYMNGGKFLIEGGTISNNAAVGDNEADDVIGGGIYVTGNGELTMTNGSIKGNEAYMGGGVALVRGNFYLENGEITGNRTSGHDISGTYFPTMYSAGGGVFIAYNSLMKMTGGAITKNIAYNGGGISVGSVNNSAFIANCTPTLRVAGGEISGNVSEGSGAGIFIQANCEAYIGDPKDNPTKIYLVDNAIKGLGSQFGGGAIYVNGGELDVFRQYRNGKLYLYNAEITGNTGVLASCPTSDVVLGTLDGMYIHDNLHNNSDMTDIYVQGTLLAGGSGGQLVGPTGTPPRVYFSPLMPGGGAFNWVDKDGNPIPLNDLDFILDRNQSLNMNINTGYKPDGEPTVVISGNTTPNGRGGAIGSNASVSLGTTTPTTEDTELVVTKAWKDNGYEHLRPEYVDVDVYQTDVYNNKVYVGFFRVRASEGWTASFGGLPKNDPDGNPYTYTVSERSSDRYISNLTKKEGEGLVDRIILVERPSKKNETEIEKTYETQKVSVKTFTFSLVNTLATHLNIEKVWKDVDRTGKLVTERPESITVEVRRKLEGSEGAPEAFEGSTIVIKPDENGNWSYSGKFVAIDENGKKYVYSIIELIDDALKHYQSSISGNHGEGIDFAYTITNTAATDVKIEKVWNDINNKGEMVGNRPKSITVMIQQQAEGGKPVTVATVELQADAKTGKWVYTGKFSLLDAYQNLVSYSIIEEALEGYLASLEGGRQEDGGYAFTLTNTPAAKVEINKVWNDVNSKGEMVGKRPESIFVEIKQHVDGSDSAPKTVAVVEIAPDENGNWKYTGNFALLDGDKNPLSYSILEQALEDYLATLSGGINANGDYSFTLTNTAIAPISVKKDWVDADGNPITDTSSLASITVEIYDENGNLVDTVVLNSENNWSYTNKYDATVSYKVVEITPLEGWTGTVTDNGKGEFTVTNKQDKKPEETVPPVTPTRTPEPTETPDDEPEDEDDDDDEPEEIPDEPTPLVEEPDEEEPTEEILDEEVPLEEAPDEEAPLEEVPDEEVPLAELPDMDIPLADVPQTGDNGVMMLYLALALCLGGVLLLKKRENDA